MEDHVPDSATISSGGFDEAKVGFYASIGLGAAVLAYAIYFVTFELTAESNDSYLILGGMLGMIALSCIGFHEWKRMQEGSVREQNMIEDYVGGIAVLCGSLSSIWLTRYLVYALNEAGFYDGQIIDNQWAPTEELAIIQAVSLLLVMEISTNMIQRHGLGTLPRTVVILAPISLSLSAITIWVDYAGGVFDSWNTVSHVLLLGAAMIHALRLDRSILYLISAGASMVVPALVAAINSVESGGWMVLMVVLVGMTATDRGLKREMMEQSSGFVIFGILVMQFVAASNDTGFQIGSFEVSNHPFGLAFWLWAALLIGWFAPTTMQRTPAMPIGLALALALLESEGALMAWAVGIAAFVYLETRDHARDWVVRSTYYAMITAWTISAIIANQNGGIFIEIGEYSFSNAFVLGLILLPVLVALGLWSESRGRFVSMSASSVAILAGALVPLADQTGWVYAALLLSIGILQIRRVDVDVHESQESVWKWGCILALLSAVSLISVRDRAMIPLEFGDFHLLPLVVGAVIYGDARFRNPDEASILLSPVVLGSVVLILVSMLCLETDITVDDINLYRFTILHIILAGGILVMECGGFGEVSPTRRLVGAAIVATFAIPSTGIFNQEDYYYEVIIERIIRDVAILAPLVIVDRLLKKIDDVSDEARKIGVGTLFTLLLIGSTDVSGGLLAFPVFIIVAYRATTHVNTGVMFALPIAGIVYAGLLTAPEIPSMNIVLALENIPYLGGDTSLGPRWICLFMLAQLLFSFYAIRTEDRPLGESRWGKEEMLTVGIAGALAFSYLIPDFRVAWIFIVVIFTGYAWKNGIIQWFYVAPLAFVWGFYNLLDWLEQEEWISRMGTDDIVAWSCLLGAIIAGMQIVILKTGVLTKYHDYEQEDKGQGNFFSTDLISYRFNEVEIIGLSSRGWLYGLLVLSAEIGFLTWIVSSLIMTLDGVVSGKKLLLYVGLMFQTISWPIMAAIDLDWTDSEISKLFFIPMVQCLVLVYLAWKGPKEFGKISMRDHGEEISKFASLWVFLVGFLYSIDGSHMVFPLVVLGVSGHHSLIGFSMDQPWRRGFGLVGIPIGFLIAVPPDAGLWFPVMLFAAALSLIGQGVLYASRGGMGIGTAKEGSESVVERIGVSKIKTEQEDSDEGDVDDPGKKSEGGGEDDGPDEVEGDEELETPEAEEAKSYPEKGMAPPQKAPPSWIPINIGEGVYSSDGSSLSVLLHPEVIGTIRRSIPADTDGGKWKPVLRVDPNGSLNVQWDPVN